jgi:hypothetical protein
MGNYHTKLGYPVPVFDLEEGGLFVSGESVSFQKWETINFASGSTSSEVKDLGEAFHAVGLFIPENFTGSTMTFSAGLDGDNVGNLQDSSALVSYPIVGRAVSLETAIFYPWRYIQLKSSNAQRSAVEVKVRLTTI